MDPVALSVGFGAGVIATLAVLVGKAAAKRRRERREEKARAGRLQGLKMEAPL